MGGNPTNFRQVCNITVTFLFAFRESRCSVIKAPLQVGAALVVPLSQLIVSAFIFSGVEQIQGKGVWVSCAALLVAEPLLRSPQLLLWD